ncbi:MAG: rod shape-determining protein MreC [Bacteroidia bacterium]|nr:rod shape-determining protein MreC [Bacteroidia bacterium]MDW8014638.1 rod shape-determining protein MreC [Bacteroidia bacterium]
MNFPLWLRLLLSPTVLWLISQGIALYVFLHYTPLPRQAIERFSLGVQKSFHEVVMWMISPWRALQEVDSLRQLVAHLQEHISTLSAESPAIPFPTSGIGDFSALKGYRLLPTKVIYRSFLLRENYAILNKGGRDGIYPGLGVLAPEGIIGLIAETTATYSIMYALFHKDVRLSVTLPQHGVVGLTRWNTPILNRLLLEYIPLHIQVKEGEEVWTASHSLIFPAGLRIGQVKSVRSDFAQGFYTIEVATYADWSRVNSLFILLPLQ